LAKFSEKIRLPLLRIKDPEYEESSFFQNFGIFQTSRRHMPGYNKFHGHRREDFQSPDIKTDVKEAGPDHVNGIYLTQN
jgi:hypothetical protein